VCIGSRRVGGGLIYPDAGTCPSGSHVEVQAGRRTCEQDYSYECVPLVGCAQTAVKCACAETSSTHICPQFSRCRDPSSADTTLSADAALICEELVP